MTELHRKNLIKKRLPRTWHTFFVRFGRLLPVQEDTIPLVLEGKNALIISSTASGKTEAVIAPLCERILKKKLSGLSVLYLTPTRALANDLFDRLQQQISSLQISLGIKTRDKPKIDWDNPPDILITTPESLDSILCRHPTNLNAIEAVVIDEIHILDNTYRGDQLRILLNRLRSLCQSFSIYALSATVYDPESVGSRYMGEYNIIQIHGFRTLQESYVPSLQAVQKITQHEQLKKLLIFCNSRRNTEEIAQDAKEYWGKNMVYVHHGSLHRREREGSEEAIKRATRAVCVSTMTLEIGIDIGDIDAVVLADLPIDKASLIQRIGRAGRRTGQIRVFAICDQYTKEDFEEMIESARANILDNKPYYEDLSVTIQQIFSLLFSQPNGIVLEEILCMFNGFCNIEIVREQIIPHLLDIGLIEKKINKLYASEMVMNLGERGAVHSNIPDRRGVLVYDLERNREIGEIYLPVETIENKKPFVLGGKRWNIISITKKRVNVKQIKERATSANFVHAMNVGAFFQYLPEDLQASELNRRTQRRH